MFRLYDIFHLSIYSHLKDDKTEGGQKISNRSITSLSQHYPFTLQLHPYWFAPPVKEDGLSEQKGSEKQELT